MRHPRLADDGLKRSDSDFIMIWDRNRYCALWKSLLHHDVATASADFDEAMPRKNRTYLFAGKNSKPTQMPPRLGLRKSRREDVA